MAIELLFLFFFLEVANTNLVPGHKLSKAIEAGINSKMLNTMAKRRKNLSNRDINLDFEFNSHVTTNIFQISC